MKLKNIEFNSIFIFLLSIITPIFINHKTLDIYPSIFLALNNWDKEHLIIAFFKLVFLNTIRAIPIYIFMFIFFQSFLNSTSTKKDKIIIFLITIIIPFFIYEVLNLLFNLSLTTGKTYFLSIIWLGFYISSNPFSLNVFEKYLILLLFIIGIQWFDILNVLRFFEVGEITLELQKVTTFMDANNIINILSILFFVLFTFISILLLYFFKRNELYKKQIEINSENRHLKEMRFLVHDLKTPLFSIGSLVELLELKGNSEDIAYFSRIRKTLNKTNIFINDILHTDSNSYFSLNELLNFIFSFLSTHEKNQSLNKVNFTSTNPYIFGNKITLSRAIINLITNSWEANATKVNLRVKEYHSFLLICIHDNGVGFKKRTLNKVFSENISTKNSSGLGLIFVKNILDNINGKIFITSRYGDTKIYIKLKKEKYKKL